MPLARPVSGAGKTTGTMDPLQQATDAADLHEWEMSLRLSSAAYTGGSA